MKMETKRESALRYWNNTSGRKGGNMLNVFLVHYFPSERDFLCDAKSKDEAIELALEAYKEFCEEDDEISSDKLNERDFETEEMDFAMLTWMLQSCDVIYVMENVIVIHDNVEIEYNYREEDDDDDE